MAPSTRLLRAVLPAALFLSCVQYVDLGEPVDPATAADHALERLEMLESFRFSLSFHSDTPFALGADMTGTWQSPDREYWKGAWTRAGERTGFEMVGAGDVQYRMEDGEWEREPRGVETRVMDQVEQLLHGKRKELVGQEGDVYRYEFSPWLPVLDPARTRTFRATLELDARNGLPLGISCVDSSGEVSWDAGFSRFNRAGRVSVPFVVRQEAVLALGGRACCGTRRRAEAILRRRLAELGWEFRLSRRWCRTVLQLGQDITRSQVEMALAPGKVEVWEAERVEGGTGTPGEVVMVGGDAAFRVRLLRLAGTNGDFEASLEQELLPEPAVSLSFEEPSALDVGPGRLLVLVLDGEGLDAVGPVTGPVVRFRRLDSRQRFAVLAAQANHAPMPVGFVVTDWR